MIQFTNKHTGGTFFVAKERKQEYIDLGHVPVEKPAPKKKPTRKRAKK